MQHLDEPFDLEAAEFQNPQIQGFIKPLRTVAGDKAWTPRMLSQAFTFDALAPKPFGKPEMVADMMEEWFYENDVDGFNLSCKCILSQ